MVGEFLQVWILKVFQLAWNNFLRDESASHSRGLRKDPEGLKLQPVMKQGNKCKLLSYSRGTMYMYLYMYQ